MEMVRVSDVRWDIPVTGGMRVPGRIFASDALMEHVDSEEAARQVMNVAHLPGIVEASFAMPDIHWGYGFPIGGVAATAVAAGGVVSPGGVGFDICCGVRLLASVFSEAEVLSRRQELMDGLARAIPRGVGRGSIAPAALMPDVLARGAVAALEAGYGVPGDLARCEEHGTTQGADPAAISAHALERGRHQLGSLGAGNHFLEIQVVGEVHDPDAAAAFGLAEGMVVVMVHCGSRGLGHQTCTDQLRTMGAAMQRHGISVPDRQLACVPVESKEGRSYLAAMSASANFAWANRHILADATRKVFAETFGVSVEGTGMRLIYDVAHNLAKLETHEVDGLPTLLCVHRKGATRAFGPGWPELADDIRPIGQPVLVPGSMGTASWVLRGMSENPAFASAAHGAGRLMSRTMARRRSPGRVVREELETAGIAVSTGSVKLLAEEAPYAYKDVDEVIDVCHRAGLAAPVARLRPLGVVKG
jgi:tRNA-splicing ligase RtcB